MKKLRISFVIVLLLVLVCGIVYANTSILKLSYSKKGKPGDSASISLSLQNSNTFDSAITSIEGYLNFDSEVFEDVTINSIESNNGKVQIGNNNLDLVDLSQYSSSSQSQINGDAGFYFNSNPSSDNDNKIVIDFASPIYEDAKLFTINLKVKSNASVQEYSKAIEVSNFKIFFEDNTMTSINSLELPFTVEGESQSNEVNNTTNNTTNNTVNNVTNNTINNVVNNSVNNVTNNAINNVVNNAVNNSVDNKTNNVIDNKSSNNSKKSNTNNAINNNSKGGKKDDSTADKNLPYTGFKTVVVPFIMLLIFSYVIYKKYNKEKID